MPIVQQLGPLAEARYVKPTRKPLKDAVVVMCYMSTCAIGRQIAFPDLYISAHEIETGELKPSYLAAMLITATIKLIAARTIIAIK